jgi:putative Ca2+/H+ antiporter (TMEM165/GDT1 family)
MKLLLAFLAIFVSELGCKSQFTALFLASNKANNLLAVFFLTSTALLLANGLAVIIGGASSKYLDIIPLKLIAGIGFLILGIWSIYEHFNGAGHMH